jgi:2-keto-4-pentenoate hydratase/2-oxohepta-3-ene-1,7-dioic acid hydratase in catechol pathway
MRAAILRFDDGPRFVHLVDDPRSRARVLDRAPWLGGKPTGEERPFTADALLCPATPSKIVCVGRNYAAHAKELGNAVPSEPLLFLKPPSALLGPGGIVRLPPESARVEHEAELAVVLGARAKNVPREDALRHVYGYTAACDVTARDLQRKDVQFTRAKSFDTFCPLGPWIETELDPGDVLVSCRVNGALRQQASSREMIFDVATVVSYVSRAMTLEPGDVILTGTPEGVGPLEANDALEVEIGGIGVLGLRVEA